MNTKAPLPAPYPSGQEGTDGRTTKMNDVSLNEIAPPRQDWLGEVGRYFPNQIQNEQEVHKLTKGRNCSEYTDLITQCFVVVFSFGFFSLPVDRANHSYLLCSSFSP